MTRLILLCLVALGLTACSKLQGAAGAVGVGSASVNRAQVEIDGVRYKAKAKADGEDKRMFAVTVTPLGANPDNALEVGSYEATRYCLLTYGGSEKEWLLGPDTPLSQLPISDNSVTLTGRCTQR